MRKSDGPMLAVEECAERYFVSARTIRWWIKSGRIHAQKIGRRWLIPRALLDDLSIGRPQQARP